MDTSDSANVTQERLGQPAGPCAMVIFGAGGDLTKRKLIPAIYNLAKGKLLPEQFAIVGVSAEQFSTDDFRQRSTTDIKEYSTSGVDMLRGIGSSSASTISPAISTTRSFTKKSKKCLAKSKRNRERRAIACFILPRVRIFSRSS